MFDEMILNWFQNVYCETKNGEIRLNDNDLSFNHFLNYFTNDMVMPAHTHKHTATLILHMLSVW